MTAVDSTFHPCVVPVIVQDRGVELPESTAPGNVMSTCWDGSDTENCGELNQLPRRLRLVWNAQHEPDSHVERFRRVRQAMQQERRAQARTVDAASEFIRRLVERVGPIEDGVPREIRGQQWSVFNVPMMWTAAEGDQECAVLNWISTISDRLPPVQTFLGEMTGREAAHVGGAHFTQQWRSWGINSREDLSEWIHNQGFRQPRWGAHFSARAQERIMNMAIAADANVAHLESVFIHVAAPSHRISISEVRLCTLRPRREDQPVHNSWEVLDGVCLAHVFQQRHVVLQSCPHHLKGRYRHMSRMALEARSNAVQVHDRVMETHGNCFAFSRIYSCVSFSVNNEAKRN